MHFPSLARAAAILAVALFALVAAAGFNLTGTAYAQTACVGGAGGGPGCATGSIGLSVPVTASVASACGFKPLEGPNASFDVGEVSAAYQRDVPFTLQCTVPLRMAVVSNNGGLKTSGAPATGYSALAPYSVKLFVQGGTTSVTDTCDASSLTVSAPAACSFRGTASTTVGLKLNEASYNVSGSYVRIFSTGYTGSSILIASNAYADTLTVTLSASP